MTESKQHQTTEFTSRGRMPRELYLQQQREITRSWLRENPIVGQWTVLGDIEIVTSIHQKILCKCTCGFEKLVRVSDLKNGGTTKCKMCVSRSQRTITEATDIEHHRFYRRLVALAKGIRQRCNNPACKCYAVYGGRGIKFNFESTEAFVRYVSKLPYQKGNSIDRIDPNGHYEVGNLRWASQKQQTRNKRDSIMLEGQHVMDVLEQVDGAEFYPSVVYNIKKGTYTTIKEIHNHIEKNKQRRITELRIKQLMEIRPDFTYESIRSFIKQGLTDEQITSKVKWGGCGRYERKTGI